MLTIETNMQKHINLQQFGHKYTYLYPSKVHGNTIVYFNICIARHHSYGTSTRRILVQYKR